MSVSVFEQPCWTIFLAAGMLIVVGIPSLSIANWVVKDRIEQTILFHSISWNTSFNRAADLISASEKEGYMGPPQTDLRNPLLPSDIINEPFEGPGSTGPGVRFLSQPSSSSAVSAPNNQAVAIKPSILDSIGASDQSTEGPPTAAVPNEQISTTVEHSELTLGEKFNSLILLGLVKCKLIVVVDPSDVRGLEAIGMGVANTFSQSLHASGGSGSLTNSSSHTMPLAYEPPVFTGDNEYGQGSGMNYSSKTASSPAPAITPAV
jgi:hypothetical protein